MGGCYDVPAVAVERHGRADEQGADRAVPRGGAPRGQLLRRADVDDAARDARDRPGRAAAAQPRADVPVPERAGPDLRLGRLRALPGPRAGGRRARAPRRREASSSARASRCTSSARAACSRAPTSRSGATAGSSSGRAPRRTARATTPRSPRSRPTASGSASDEVELHFGDSAEAPAGIGTFGSRSLVVGGSAVALAVDEIAEQARALAAGRDMTLAEIAAAAPEPLHAERRFTTDVTMSSGAHAAVVEIERATGVLRILRYAAVDDAGTIVNPLLVHGQVVGGIVQGIGAVPARRSSTTRPASRAPRRCSTTGCRPRPRSRRCASRRWRRPRR